MVGAELMHLSDQSTPLNADTLTRVANEAVGSHATRTGGLTERLQTARTKFIESAYIQDLGAIPATKKLDYHRMCNHKHPGVCQRDLTGSVKLLHDMLFKEVGSWAVDSFYSVTVEYYKPSEELVGLVWYNVKGNTVKGGFINAEVVATGHGDNVVPKFVEASDAGWKFSMSQALVFPLCTCLGLI